jgi:hypothetical protein
MPIQVTRMTEADIDGAIDTIQQAFAEDPYNLWIYPDRSKVRASPSHLTRNPPLTLLLLDRPNPQPHLPNPPLPLGHPTRPLPRRPRPLKLQSHKDPRLRNVDAPSPTLAARILVAVPLVLVLMALPDPHEPHLRPRRALHKAILDLESASGRSAKSALDE